MKITSAILAAATAAACQPTITGLPASGTLIAGSIDTITCVNPATSLMFVDDTNSAGKIRNGNGITTCALASVLIGVSKNSEYIYVITIPNSFVSPTGGTYKCFPDKRDLNSNVQFSTDSLRLYAYNAGKIVDSSLQMYQVDTVVKTSVMRPPQSKAPPILRSTRKVTYDLTGRLATQTKNRYQFLIIK